MLDLRGGNQPRGIQYKISRKFFLAHLGEMRGVRTVVAADDKQKIHFDVKQLAQCILALLRRAADGIEEPEILLGQFRSISINNSALNSPLHLLRFPT